MGTRNTAGLTKKTVTVRGKKGSYQRSVMVRAAGAKSTKRSAAPSLTRQSMRHGFLGGLRQGIGFHSGAKMASRLGQGQHSFKGAVAGMALGTAAAMHNIHKDKKFNQQWRGSSHGQQTRAHLAGSAANIAGGIAGMAVSHFGHTGYDAIKRGIQLRRGQH